MKRMVCALICGAAMAGAAAGAPIPVILDTDIGGDIDDTWALCMLLGSPELDLKMVLTAFRDTHRKARLVAKILERTGRTDIPVGIGVRTSEEPLNQEAWIEGYALDDYPGVVHEDGVQAAIDLIQSSDPAPVLIVIGPQTNFPAMLERAPEVAEKTRVVSMAGSVYVGYRGAEKPCPEWNVRANVEAARALFGAPWDITITPLDTCGALRLEGARFERVANAKTPRAQVVMENYAIWTHRDKYPENASSILFDTVAVYLAFDQALCEMKTLKLSVDDKGMTVPVETGRPVHCALAWKDEEAFKDLLVERLVTPLPQTP